MSKITATVARAKLTEGYALWYDEKNSTFRVGPYAVHANFARGLINGKKVKLDAFGKMVRV